MAAVIVFVLMVFAFVLFALAIPPLSVRFNLVAAGLACWALAALISGGLPTS